MQGNRYHFNYTEKPPYLLVIVGPTAVGKTALSIELAKAFTGEVISGDSMQVYRGMNVGTAKIVPEEQEGVPHHLLDILEPEEDFSVSRFQELAQGKIEEISQRGHLPMLVGGTGLYVQSVTHNFSFADSPNPELEDERAAYWEAFLEEHGQAALYRELELKDAQFAKTLHPNNVRRVLRALVVLEVTGKSMQEYQQDWDNQSPYRLVMIGLTMPREQLYARINMRVDLMLEQGLLEEVRELLNQGVSPKATAMQAIGYKELVAHLHGEYSYERAIELLKRNTRRFAKRQLTWFRRMEELKWFDVTQFHSTEEQVGVISKYVAGKFNSMTNIV